MSSAADELDLIVRNSAELRGGPVANFQGTWSAINFRVGDTVLFSGCIYLCILNTVANEPPGNTTYWIKLGSNGGINFRQIVVDRLSQNTFSTALRTNGSIDSPTEDSEISFDMNTGVFTFILAQDRTSLVFRGIGGGGATWLNEANSGGGGSGIATVNVRNAITDPFYDPFVGTSLTSGNQYIFEAGLGGIALGPGNSPTNGSFSCVTNSQDNSDVIYAGGGEGGNPTEDGGGAGLAPISIQGGQSSNQAGGGGAGGVGGGGGAASGPGGGAGGGGGIGGSGGDGSAGAMGGAGGSLDGNGADGTITGSSGGGGGYNDQPGLFSGDGGDGYGGVGGLQEGQPGQPGIYPLYTTLGVSPDRRKWPGTGGFAVIGRNNGVGGRIIIEYTW